MARRTLAASVVLAAMAIGVPAGTSAPVAAQPGPAAPVHISGNFTGDPREEVFAYLPNSVDSDFLIAFNNGGTHGGPLAWNIYPHDVGGNSYVPVAGDFDGDGYDEIFWHGPGSAPDSMWHFQSPTSIVSVPFSVSGSYEPLVGDYTGDGVDDVHWYRAGLTGDPLWEFNQGGSFVGQVRIVSGDYRPVVASVGKDNTDDTLWYAPGGTPDILWDWNQTSTNSTSFTQQTLAVNSSAYLPFAFDYFGDGPRGGDIYWYAQGPGGDPVWDYLSGNVLRDIDNVASPYDDQFDQAVAGDFFADGHDDILFATNGDLTDFTLYDSNLFGDVVYDVTPAIASSGAGAGVEATRVDGASR